MLTVDIGTAEPVTTKCPADGRVTIVTCKAGSVRLAISVVPTGVPLYSPTVMQSPPGGQATLLKSLECIGSMFGDGMIDQVVPFHCSINVCCTPGLYSPTAEQSELETQATATSAFCCVGLVLGEEMMDHDVPFQCRTKV